MSAAEWIEGAGGGGKGGGGSQRTPQEAPNTLRSTSKARIIDALGEGEIVGLANGLQSVFLDDTPLQDESGAFNFQGVTVHTRTGEPDQPHIPGFPAVETANDVSTEVTQGAPIVRTVGNLDADAVRVTVQLPALNEQNTSNGDLLGASVEVAIDVRPMGGTWAERKRDTIAGKTTSPYQRTYRIELTGSGPWDVRVRRITPDSDAATLNNATYWATYTEVIDAKLSYPDTALVALEVDAQQFGNQIPARSYDVKGLIIRVPDNYDPATRSYSGFWGGNFKLAWSDNPAWCYYDLATKTRYGAALANVDKWALYQIAQYCDERVPDGFGGEEPRFTFNTVLASAEDAITALHTLASAFRGMTYWGTNTVMPVADMPADPVKLVTPANVIDGEFVYEGTGLKARHSVAMVSYNDPNDNYRQQVEVVEDAEAIELYGWRPLEINAVACTSRGQAHRLGKWTLASERAETETVSYRASLDHADVRPGDIISVSDPTTAGARLGGRVVVAGTEALTLDNVPEQASGANWFLDVMLPSGAVERRAVASFNGDEVALANPLSAPPIVGAVWILSSQAVEPRRFRVLANIEEAARVYHITALEHDPTKYGRIELGLDLPEPDYSLLPTGPVVAPYSLTAQAFTYLAGGTEHQGMTISWTPSDDPRVLRYLVEVQGPTDLRWRTVYTESGTSVDLRDVEPGQWMIRVRGITGIGTASPWAALTTNIAGLLLPVPPDSVDIEVGTFTITLRPRGAYPGQMFEFWRSNVALALNQITSNAVRLTVSTDLTDTELSPGTTYYYYVRGANAYGVSAWYPVQATTDTTPEKLLEALTGEIRESALDQSLQQRIDKIDGPASLEGSVAQQVAQEAATRAQALNAEAQARAEGLAAEAQARANALSAEASDRADAIAAEAQARTQEIADEAAARSAAITAEQQARIDALDQERSERIDSFAAEAQARADAIAAETQNRTVAITQLSDTVEAEFDLLGLELNAIAAAYDATAASIYTMTQIRINDAEVVATQISQLSGKVDDNAALILDERQIRIDQYSSLATQVGILSARLDARPSLNSGFEPGSDFDAWSATSGNGISAVTSGVYSGLQSALVTSTTSSANPNSGGVRRIIAPETAAEFSGHEIRLAIYAKQPATGAAAEFALAYQVAGQSVQWQRFTPSAEWAFYDVVIDVPEGTGGAQHAVAIWGSTAGGGNGVEVDRLLVTFAETDIPEVTAAIEQIQQALVDQQQAVAQELSGFEAQLNSNAAAIQQETTARTTATDALAEDVQTLQASTQQNAAAIVAEREAWTTETEALAQDLLQQTARIEGGEATLEELQQVSASEDEYLASLQRVMIAAEGVNAASYQYTVQTRVTQWEAQTVVNEQLLAQIGDANAAIEREALVRANENEALAQLIEEQAASFTDNTAALQSEATARADADEALGQRIDSVVATSNSNASAIQSEAIARANAVDALTSQINTAQSKANSNAALIQNEASTRASADQALTQQVSTAISKADDNTAAIQSEATTRASADSSLSQRINAVVATANSNTAAISSEQTARANADSALSNRVDNVVATANGNTAAIQEEATTRANADSALSNLIQSVNSSLGGDIAAVNTLIETAIAGESVVKNGLFSTGTFAGWELVWSEMQITERNLNSGSNAVKTMPARYSARFPNTGHTDLQRLRSEYMPVVAGDVYTLMIDYATAGASSSATFRFYVGWSGEGLSEQWDYITISTTSTSWAKSEPFTVVAPQGATQARVLIRRETGGNGDLYVTNIRGYRIDDAMARRIDELVVTAGNNASAIQSEATTRANAVSSLTSQINTAQSKADSNSAAIQSEATTRANAVSSLAQQINTVQSEFDDELASVQQSTQAQYNQTTQRLEAMWTLRIDNGGRVSGFGLGDDGEESLLGFRADRIYFAHPDSNDAAYPMILDGGSVVMNDALIKQLLFTKLRSSDGSLVFQNGKLQAEYIAADQLSVNWAQIQNVTITNAQMGIASIDTLQLAGNAVTLRTSTAASSLLTITPGQGWAPILADSINARGANVIVDLSFGVTSGELGGIEIRRNGQVVVARPGGTKTLSITAHVGSESSGQSTYSVYVYAVGGNATIAGRTLGLDTSFR
ncbi:phage tail protein [Halomonas sp. BMC6]|uniref:TipJ family phage tail tip protein n=1 Tax=Halomonas sp. BMC6 TaxID=3073244 RepID=UPI0030CB6527